MMFCLWPEGVVKSLFIANAIERMNNVDQLFRFDSVQSAVINIGYFQQKVDSGLTDFSFATKDLTHPTVIDNGLCKLLLRSYDHVVSRPESQDARCTRGCACRGSRLCAPSAHNFNFSTSVLPLSCQLVREVVKKQQIWTYRRNRKRTIQAVPIRNNLSEPLSISNSS